jgi:hypothetical protein
MDRFFGHVGYGTPTETAPGVWEDKIVEAEYYGDVIRAAGKPEPTDTLNQGISVGNSISVLADPYAFDHFLKIKYVRWAGVRWIVTNVEIASPRLILSLGSVYNGPEPD